MKFPIPAYIFFGLFVVAAIVQLFFAFIENQKLRRREKFLCMLMLGIATVIAFPNEPLIYVGAFLGMIGDILVLRTKTFTFGSVSFLLGHFCYIFEALCKVVGFENLEIWHPFLFIGTFVVIFVGMFLACKFKTKHTKFDCIAQSLYFAVQVTYIPVFIISMVTVGSFMYLCLIGACLFIVSDGILIKNHFGKKWKRYDFYIMLTYLLAEALIIVGFALTLVR